MQPCLWDSLRLSRDSPLGGATCPKLFAMKRVARRLKRVLFAFLADDAPTAAAAISFYTVTALSPLLVVMVSLAAVVVPDQEFRGHLLRQTDLMFGSVIGGFVGTVLQQSKAAYGYTAAAGFLFILVTSAALISQLHISLNRVWNIQPRAGAPWKKLLRDRAMALVVVLLTGALLITSLFVSTWLGVVDRWATQHLHFSAVTVTLTQNGFSFVLLTLMCALLFRTLPDITIAWRDVVAGAAMAAGLFLIAKSLIAFWLSGFDVTARYGQVGAVVLLLLWIYFSSVIFLLGAEWTKVQADARGRSIRSASRSKVSRLLGDCQNYPRVEMVVPFFTPSEPAP